MLKRSMNQNVAITWSGPLDDDVSAVIRTLRIQFGEHVLVGNLFNGGPRRKVWQNL